MYHWKKIHVYNQDSFFTHVDFDPLFKMLIYLKHL